ncbi:MAG: PEP-CTERM sorting domain-containing protein [Sedimentisphaerales bacterium]|nr:PEP-CTERM sorting domain-containing protein [Sedimentisphaerales bacterium]
MKKLVICVAVLAMVWTSSAMAVPVYVENAGFELPDYYRKINGFDGEVLNPDYPGSSPDEYLPDVPGWEDDCTRDWPRSGVHGDITGNPVYEGAWRAFLYHGDGEGYAEDVIYQVTDQTIAACEIYTLSAQGMSGGTYGTTVRLDLSFFYVDGTGGHVALASNFTDMADDDEWHLCTAGFTVDADGIGEKLGIKFTSVDVGNANVGWLGFDDVQLDVIPEPATMMLLGLGSLALLKRRRA